MATVGIDMMTAWGTEAITQRLQMLTTRLAAGLQDVDVQILKPRFRAPHILSLNFGAGMPPGLVEALAAQNVYVAPRLGRLRISPHVYNDEADVDGFLVAFCSSFAQLTRH
jgi:selenocysteine lyase/cysteine desulfurase